MEVKTNVPGIYKTPNGALINRDNEALRAYKQQKQRAKQVREMNDEVAELKNDVASMKDDLNEIKNLLKGLTK